MKWRTVVLVLVMLVTMTLLSGCWVEDVANWVNRNLFFGSTWTDPAPFPGGGLPEVYGGGWKGTW